jgi:hypothetical protein
MAKRKQPTSFDIKLHALILALMRAIGLDV